MADDASPETDPSTEPAPPAVERSWRPAAPTTDPSPDAGPDPDAGPEPASDDSPSDGPSGPEAERPSEGGPADTAEGDAPEERPPAEAAPVEEPDDVPGADASARDAAPSDDGARPDATAPAPAPPSAPDDGASAPPDEATDDPPAAPSPEQAAGPTAPEDGGTEAAPQGPPPADTPGRPVPAGADSRDEADADEASPDSSPETGDDRSPTDAGPSREGSSGSPAPDDALPPDAADPAGTAAPEQERETDPDRAAARAEGKRINEEAFADAQDASSWTDRLDDADRRSDPSRARDADRTDFYTDQRHGVRGAEQIEEEIQDFVYEVNEGTAGTDWTPETVQDRKTVRDRKTAAMFAILVSKVAEDMSYERRPGDEFWDPRKIMRRQIDNRPLRHCKMDYTKRRLALLVDTSPSCRDEAAFYSKIASGAMLRDDIDLFLCPNGRIDARFDPDPMRFVDDDRGADWALDGRTVLYFTDWDGADEIVTHSRACTLYWFDHCPPADYWESARDRHQRIRLRYRGRHFYCPGPDAFRRLARKIRP